MDAMETPLPIWIDPSELEELERRYPQLTRTDLASTLERHWPLREDVEAAIHLLLEARGANFPRLATG
jgi:hypothetical protein